MSSGDGGRGSSPTVREGSRFEKRPSLTVGFLTLPQRKARHFHLNIGAVVAVGKSFQQH
jgi:hypothetical protein